MDFRKAAGRPALAGMVAVLAALTMAAAAAAPRPPTTLNAPPPAGAVVLFDGKNTSAWQSSWKLEKDAMIAGGGSIVSKQEFADCLLHVEFRTPYMPDKKGQERGNSGVFLQGRYEIQVLDSYGITDPGRGDCGAVYDQAAPLVNACKPPLQWQTYDIVFRAPRFDAAGKLTERPRVTVFQNGLLVQNNQEISGPTANGPSEDMPKTGPVLLQDHGNPVAYRNVWVLPLPASGASHY